MKKLSDLLGKINSHRNKILFYSFIFFILTSVVNLMFGTNRDFLLLVSITFSTIVLSLSVYNFLARLQKAYQKYLLSKFWITLLTVPIVSELTSRLGNLIFGIKPSYFPFLDKVYFFMIEVFVLFLLLSISVLIEKIKGDYKANEKKHDPLLYTYGFFFLLVGFVFLIGVVSKSYISLAKVVYNSNSFSRAFYRGSLNETPLLFQKEFCHFKNNKYSNDFSFFYNDSKVICQIKETKRFEIQKIWLVKDLFRETGS